MRLQTGTPGTLPRSGFVQPGVCTVRLRRPLIAQALAGRDCRLQMDFQLHRLPDYSDDSLLEELRRVASMVPSGALTRTAFDRHSQASASTAMKRFGGWQQALEAAGLASRYSGQPGSDRKREQPGKAVSRNDVLGELHRVAGVLS